MSPGQQVLLGAHSVDCPAEVQQADVPRTATVVSRTDVELLEIGRSAFLTAVTGHDASRQAAWGVARTSYPEVDAEVAAEQ